MRDFRKLEIWGQSVAFAKRVYELTASFPSHEKYGLSSQMNRAVVSISSNIAEGCSRRTNIEFTRFLDIALGSSFELETQLEIARQISYLSQELYENLLLELNILQKRINSFREKIKAAG